LNKENILLQQEACQIEMGIESALYFIQN